MATLCCWPFVVGWNVFISHLLHNPHNTSRIFSFLQKELQNLEDAGDELMMLDDDTTPIPYPFSNFYIFIFFLQFKWLFFFWRKSCICLFEPVFLCWYPQFHSQSYWRLKRKINKKLSYLKKKKEMSLTVTLLLSNFYSCNWDSISVTFFS